MSSESVQISPVPSILVSLAPKPETPAEPRSPFGPWSPVVSPVDNDGYRPQHLTPPPTSIRFRNGPSPLRPAELSPPAGKGLERERFEVLLQTARERNAPVSAKREQDLRKEIAMKAHKNKQVERRALFLSKVLAPPSPTATLTPKTPPESPAVFHYSLPSPGLESPLSLFESLGSGDAALGAFLLAREPWVEQVDFRLPDDEWKAKAAAKTPPPRKPVLPKSSRGKPLPSLDQITAHLSSLRQVPSQPRRADEDQEKRHPSGRLPAFLRTSTHQDAATTAISPMPKPVLSIAIDPKGPEPTPFLPPSPHSPLAPKLQITTTVVPCTTPTMSPTTLSKTNLLAFNTHRERRSRDMLQALERRCRPATSTGDVSEEDSETDDRKPKRRSSPAELPQRQRIGFEHPVLMMPGGF